MTAARLERYGVESRDLSWLSGRHRTTMEPTAQVEEVRMRESLFPRRRQPLRRAVAVSVRPVGLYPSGRERRNTECNTNSIKEA